MTRSSLYNIFFSISSALSKLDNIDDVFAFCRDLMTETEMKEFARRLQVAEMLSQGYSYNIIEKKTAMSSTTIARISKYLKGNYGGYRQVLDLSTHHLPGS